MDRIVKVIRYFILFNVLFGALKGVNIKAQTNTITWDEFVQQLIDDDESETQGVETLVEQLYEIYNNKIDINKATQNDLRQLPFIDEKDIENILQYVYVYGPVKSLSELQLVNKLDYKKRTFLELFLTASNNTTTEVTYPSLRQILKYGRSELVARTDIPLGYKKAGYKHYSDSILKKYPNRKYNGNALYHSIRYNFHYKDNLYLGFTAEKDAGEPFFKGSNKTFDFYSFYLMLQNIGIVKRAIVGRYKLSFGQGLVLNSGFQYGKSSALRSLNNNGGIKKHSSTSEYGFFTGAAVTINNKHYEQTVYYSYQPMDATLTNDSLISTIKDDGLHRTKSEIDKKHNIYNTLAGSNITFTFNNFKVGATFVYNHFNTAFKEPTLYYKEFDPVGSTFYNGSVNIEYVNRFVNYSAEIATSNSGGIAAINYINISPVLGWNIVCIPRFYSYRYNAIYSNSFSAGSKAKNERGLYLGTTFDINRYLKQELYGDWYYFPKPKYLVTASSHGTDVYSLTTWEPTRSFSLSARYRGKRSQKDYKIDKNEKVLATYWLHTARLQGTLNVSQFKFKTTGSYSLYRSKYTSSRGFLVQQSVNYATKNNKFRTNLDVTWFNTDDYDSRIYAYEHNLLYTFSYPSFYSHGMRYALTSKYIPHKNISILLKAGMTRYTNKDKIGSSQEEIDSNHKQDLQVQVMYKF